MMYKYRCKLCGEDKESLGPVPDELCDSCWELKIRLPTADKLKEWLAKNYSHLNPDLAPFFWMGVEALYVKLGGERFLEIRIPKEDKE